MSLEPDELLLLILDSADEQKIAGRTAIQKIAYFNSVVLDLDLQYRPRFYGPYSPVVDSSLMDLIASDFVDEKEKLTFRDRTMFIYQLTGDGQELADSLKEKESGQLSTIKRIVDQCERLGNDIAVLSYAAKVHYLISRKDPPTSYGDAIGMAKSLHWKLSSDDVDSGVQLLTSLGLANRSD